MSIDKSKDELRMKENCFENKELLRYLFSRFKKKFLVIIFLLLIIFVSAIFLNLYLKNFSDSFSYIIGIYGIIITVIFFDFIVFDKEKEAKYWNNESNIDKLNKNLDFFQHLMLSDNKVPLKTWKDQISDLNNYNELLKKSDKLFLSNEKNEFEELVDKLRKIDYGLTTHKTNLDFINCAEINKIEASECNDKLRKLIDHIEMKKETDSK